MNYKKITTTSFITEVCVPVRERVEIVLIIIGGQRVGFPVNLVVGPFACHGPSLRHLIWQTFPHWHLICASHGELSTPLSLLRTEIPAACARCHSTLRPFITITEIIVSWTYCTYELCERGRLPSPNRDDGVFMKCPDFGKCSLLISEKNALFIYWIVFLFIWITANAFRKCIKSIYIL